MARDVCVRLLIIGVIGKVMLEYVRITGQQPLICPAILLLMFVLTVVPKKALSNLIEPLIDLLRWIAKIRTK